MIDDGSAPPAAVLRSLVARAVDADPADLGDRVEVVERGGGRAGGEAAGGDDGVPDPAGRLAEIAGESERVVAVVPRFDADLARRLNASLTRPVGGRDDRDDRGGGADGGDGADRVPSDVRVAFTGAASDRLAGATGALVRRALADRGVDAYRHDGDSPVAVVLCDERAAVGLVDETGVAALLWTDDAAVREWAAATCRRYLAAAEPVGER